MYDSEKSRFIKEKKAKVLLTGFLEPKSPSEGVPMLVKII